jgi:hypothetical protein
MVILMALPGPIAITNLVFSPGQTQRYWETVPWMYLLGPALVLLARRSPLLLVGVLLASLALTPTRALLPDRASWVSVTVGVVTLVAVVLALAGVRPRLSTRRAGPVWVALLAVAVLAGSFEVSLRPAVAEVRHGKVQSKLTNEMSDGSIAFLRAHDSNIPVILAPYKAGTGCWYTGIAYDLVGNASVYAVAISGFHTEAEPKDHPRQRRLDVNRFLNPATSSAARDAILKRYGVNLVALDLKHTPSSLIADLRSDPRLHVVYIDPAVQESEYVRFIIFAVRR